MIPDVSGDDSPVSSDVASRDGLRRRLLRLGGPDGVMAGIAIDHRDSLRVTLEKRGVSGMTISDMRRLKLALTRVLAPAATALMLDAELGALAFEQAPCPPRPA